MMISKIRKRDGRYVKFNEEKITQAMMKAIFAVNAEVTTNKLNKMTNEVIKEINDKTPDGRVPTVEDVQDAVEKVLMASKLPEVAKAYILYRKERSQIRDKDSNLMQKFQTIDEKKETEYQLESYGLIQSNSALKLLYKYGEEGSKEYNKMFILNPKFTKAIEENEIDVKNIEFYRTAIDSNILDLESIFEKGYQDEYLTISKPNNLEAGIDLITKLLYKNQNDVFGMQVISNIDSLLGKLVTVEDLNKPEKIFKTLDLFYQNLLFVFSNEDRNFPKLTIDYGLDTSLSGKLITETLLKLNYKYPVLCHNQIFKLNNEINYYKDSPNHDLYLEVVNLIQSNHCLNLSFLNNSFNNQTTVYDVRGIRISANKHDDFFELKPVGRGNLFTTTINLLVVAQKVKRFEEFKLELDRSLDLVIAQQIERLKHISKLRVQNLPTLTKQNLWTTSKYIQTNEPVEKAFRNGNITIGFSFLEEAVYYLHGNEISKENLYRFSSQIIEFMNDKLKLTSNKYGLIFNLFSEDKYSSIKEIFFHKLTQGGHKLNFSLTKFNADNTIDCLLKKDCGFVSFVKVEEEVKHDG